LAQSTDAWINYRCVAASRVRRRTQEISATDDELDEDFDDELLLEEEEEEELE
jgi:hypothetical protein